MFLAGQFRLSASPAIEGGSSETGESTGPREIKEPGNEGFASQGAEKAVESRKGPGSPADAGIPDFDSAVEKHHE